MPQTLTGWILIAAVIIAGASGGYSAARVITTVRDGQEIDRRDVVAAATFVSILILSGLLLWLVEAH